jgi:predicted CopG family antitoxin
MKRDRQLKIRISDEEWEMLDAIIDFEDRSASESIREFVHRRYHEIEERSPDDPKALAEDLRRIAARIDKLPPASGGRRSRGSR